MPPRYRPPRFIPLLLYSQKLAKALLIKANDEFPVNINDRNSHLPGTRDHFVPPFLINNDVVLFEINFILRKKLFRLLAIDADGCCKNPYFFRLIRHRTNILLMYKYAYRQTPAHSLLFATENISRGLYTRSISYESLSNIYKSVDWV